MSIGKLRRPSTETKCYGQKNLTHQATIPEKCKAKEGILMMTTCSVSYFLCYVHNNNPLHPVLEGCEGFLLENNSFTLQSSLTVSITGEQ